MKFSFSIIVPSYQQGEFLSKNLESLLQQGDPSQIEVIVQDGGSKDNSVEIIKSYEHHPWKRYLWESKPDKGQTDAINQGIAKATGDIIGYLNSDDYLMPGALKKVGEFFNANPDCQMLYGKAIHTDETGQFIGDYPTEQWSLRRLLETCFICQPACFWRRELHEKIGLFDESLNFGMDHDFWLRTGQVTKPQYFEETLAASRCHAEAKRFAKEAEMRKESLKIIRKYNNGKAPYPWITGYARTSASRHFRKNIPHLFSSILFCLNYWILLISKLHLIDKTHSKMPLNKFTPPLTSSLASFRDPHFHLR